LFDKNKAIKTLDDAKEFYHALGCNSFYMQREYPERYEEFLSLNISRHILLKWESEKTDYIYKKIVIDYYDNLGLAFFHYLELIKNEKRLQTIKNSVRAYKIVSKKYSKLSSEYMFATAESLSYVGIYRRAKGLKKVLLYPLKRKYNKLIRRMIIKSCRENPELIDRFKRTIHLPKEIIDNREKIIYEIKKAL